MSKDINKDELENLEKPDKSLECRIQKLEDEVGKLGEKVDKTNELLEDIRRIMKSSLKEVVGDQRHAKELEELTEKQKSERND